MDAIALFALFVLITLFVYRTHGTPTPKPEWFNNDASDVQWNNLDDNVKNSAVEFVDQHARLDGCALTYAFYSNRHGLWLQYIVHEQHASATFKKDAGWTLSRGLQ